MTRGTVGTAIRLRPGGTPYTAIARAPGVGHGTVRRELKARFRWRPPRMPASRRIDTGPAMIPEEDRSWDLSYV